MDSQHTAVKQQANKIGSAVWFLAVSKINVTLKEKNLKIIRE